MSALDNMANEAKTAYVDTGIPIFIDNKTVTFTYNKDKLDAIHKLFNGKVIRDEYSSDRIEILHWIEACSSAKLSGSKVTINELWKYLPSENCPERHVVYNIMSVLNTENINNFGFTRMDNIANYWTYLMEYCLQNKHSKYYQFRPIQIENKISGRYTIPAEMVTEAIEAMYSWECTSPVLEGIVRSFYVMWILPFMEGNDVLSRAIISIDSNREFVPFSYFILKDGRDYYFDVLKMSSMPTDKGLDISPYVNYMISRIYNASLMVEDFDRELSMKELAVLEDVKNRNPALSPLTYDSVRMELEVLLEHGYVEFDEVNKEYLYLDYSSNKNPKYEDRK